MPIRDFPAPAGYADPPSEAGFAILGFGVADLPKIGTARAGLRAPREPARLSRAYQPARPYRLRRVAASALTTPVGARCSSNQNNPRTEPAGRCRSMLRGYRIWRSAIHCYIQGQRQPLDVALGAQRHNLRAAKLPPQGGLMNLTCSIVRQRINKDNGLWEFVSGEPAGTMLQKLGF